MIRRENLSNEELDEFLELVGHAAARVFDLEAARTRDRKTLYTLSAKEELDRMRRRLGDLMTAAREDGGVEMKDKGCPFCSAPKVSDGVFSCGTGTKTGSPVRCESKSEIDPLRAALAAAERERDEALVARTGYRESRNGLQAILAEARQQLAAEKERAERAEAELANGAMRRAFDKIADYVCPGWEYPGQVVRAVIVEMMEHEECEACEGTGLDCPDSCGPAIHQDCEDCDIDECPHCHGLGHRPGPSHTVALGKVYPRKDDE